MGNGTLQRKAETIGFKVVRQDFFHIPTWLRMELQSAQINLFITMPVCVLIHLAPILARTDGKMRYVRMSETLLFWITRQLRKLKDTKCPAEWFLNLSLSIIDFREEIPQLHLPAESNPSPCLLSFGCNCVMKMRLSHSITAHFLRFYSSDKRYLQLF